MQPVIVYSWSAPFRHKLTGLLLAPPPCLYVCLLKHRGNALYYSERKMEVCLAADPLTLSPAYACAEKASLLCC